MKDKYEIKINIKRELFDGILTLTNFTSSPQNIIAERMSADIIDFRDKTVRDALISLGWTPPGGCQSEKNAVRAVVYRLMRATQTKVPPEMINTQLGADAINLQAELNRILAELETDA